MQIPVYGQGDPRWRNVELAPGVPMWRWGCMITSLSMGLAAYGIEVTPGELCLKLRKVGGLDAEGNLDHDAFEALYPSVKFHERVWTTNVQGSTPKPKTLIAAALKRAENIISLGQPLVLNVDNIGNDGIQDHFVLAVEARDGDFLINNPDGGVQEWFSRRYGDPARKLFGHYAVLGPSAWYPTNSSEERRRMGLAVGFAAAVLRGKNVASNAQSIVEALL